MGTEFSWFYDVMALAAVLVCLFFGAKKGLIRSGITLVGFLISLMLAFALGNSLSGSIYNGTIFNSNVRKINQALEDDMFIIKFEEYIENLDYNVNVKRENLEKIMESGENVDAQLYKYVNNINGRKVAEEDEFMNQIHEGYAAVTKDLVSRQLSKYAAESAAEKIRNSNESFDEFASLVISKDTTPASKYISKNYISDAYKTVIKLICFVTVFIIGILISLAVSKAFNDSESTKSIGSHVAGGIIGVIYGVVLVFVIAAFVRLNATMGSNEMLFFNNEAVENTIAFKYIYGLISKM